ncbi:Smr/MutS family protein [Dehalobacterium formicoaceticum]|uniref:Smr/MutS family protein n=1 Tax=Dehalobacterium formicoaceticum TaxID=51515 RepID=A0ABT1Y079_9FIRM|nr:Smr/MutS family protein [Dehalobacterium formicoaceticum]MCR6544266.1 Smr/MutS family protein [Dehalobacterium formicoaceticum]
MNTNQPQGIVDLDIHGMNKYQAKILIDNRLKSAAADIYIIRVVHGYHSGTELRDMVRKEYKGNPKVKRIQYGMNPGVTELILRELF